VLVAPLAANADHVTATTKPLEHKPMEPASEEAYWKERLPGSHPANGEPTMNDPTLQRLEDEYGRALAEWMQAIKAFDAAKDREERTSNQTEACRVRLERYRIEITTPPPQEPKP
jgi:hypothetical protein